MFLEIILETIEDGKAIVLPIFGILWQFLKLWWWLILPFVLIKPFIFFWLWWRTEHWIAENVKMIVLEIKPPKEVLTPIKAMETVFAGLWHIYDGPNPREKWLDGKVQLSMSLEMVSIGGEQHFFIRCNKGSRDLIESNIYSQYPDVEITEVEDYIKNVPQDIPNKDWNMWGCDYELLKEDVYPIKTYDKFFEKTPESSKEEKRIDPISGLLEGMARFKQGEQLWIQIIITPVVAGIESDYNKRGKAEVDKIIKRPKPKKSKSMVQELAEEGVSIVTTGEIPAGGGEEKKAEFFAPEMELTPGEREVVAAIEEKVGKYAFLCNIRFVHLGKKPGYFGGRKTIPMGFFDQFSTVNLNALKPWKRSITKLYTVWTWFLDERRIYMRKRAMFRNYIERNSPLFPRDSKESVFILNIEELASLFHFPGRMVTAAPLMSRVESRKGEAPKELPVEE